jgi:SAM-dependent methyltransferase
VAQSAGRRQSSWIAPAIDLALEREFPGHEFLVRFLDELYGKELAHDPTNAYLLDHAATSSVAAQATMFRWYWPWIKDAHAVLDWGCQHGPDSAMLRHAHDAIGTSPAVSIFGCDLPTDASYPNFREASGLQYLTLTSVQSLPYADSRFDAVIASGVLEHVAFDVDSLRELYRVLRPSGRLVITFLPNALSLEEFQRRRHAGGHHERVYRRRAARDLLLHNGFRPITPVLYQTPAWQRQVERVLGPGTAADRLTAILRVSLPVHVFRASTLCVVAEKTDGFA